MFLVFYLSFLPLSCPPLGSECCSLIDLGLTAALYDILVERIAPSTGFESSTFENNALIEIVGDVN